MKIQYLPDTNSVNRNLILINFIKCSFWFLSGWISGVVGSMITKETILKFFIIAFIFAIVIYIIKESSVYYLDKKIEEEITKNI